MDDKPAILPFTTRTSAALKPIVSPEEKDPASEWVDPGQAFAVVTGGRSAVTCEFIRRDGSSFSMPYSYAPLLWWHPPGLLILEYPGFFSVTLRGSHLVELHRRLRDRKVTWVCETGVIETTDVASITSLEIVHQFPSRERPGKLVLGEG